MLVWGGDGAAKDTSRAITREGGRGIQASRLAPHDVVCATVGLARDDRNLGDSRLGVCIPARRGDSGNRGVSQAGLSVGAHCRGLGGGHDAQLPRC